MDEQLTISTPEQVAFQYEMAGIGSRFVAALLDHFILFVIIVLLSIAASFVDFSATFAGGADGGAAAYLVLALLTIVVFLSIFGYFIVFETVWNGQTPGKRASGLRVIRHNGQPIGAGEAMIRNLVRLVDFLPGFYGIGLVTMFVDKDARRLGDFAAGTIVVREGHQTRLRDVQVGQASRPPYSEPASYVSPSAQPYSQPYSSAYGSAGPIQQPQSLTQSRLDPLPGVSTRDVTREDSALMRELLARVSRGELPRDRGQELAARMAHGVALRMGQNFAQWQAKGWEPLVFLQAVLDARDARGE